MRMETISYPNCIYLTCVVGVSILKKDGFIIYKEFNQANSYVKQPRMIIQGKTGRLIFQLKIIAVNVSPFKDV